MNYSRWLTRWTDPESHHQEDSALSKDKGIREVLDCPPYLLHTERLPIFADVQPAGVDGSGELLCLHPAITFREKIDYGFFNFHDQICRFPLRGISRIQSPSSTD